MIKVIGAGFGRTGTLTLKHALERLGFGKCYHMEELLANPHHVEYWKPLFEGKEIDFDALFKGYQSTVDFPGYRMYKEIYKKYPSAKVILQVREPEKWYESALNTIYKAGPSLPKKILMSFKMPFSPRLRKLVKVFMLADNYVWKRDFQGKFEDKAFAIKIFNDHIEEVKKNIPADKLLIYQVKEGWEPLCKFLNVPVPNEPFPVSNERLEFKRKNEELMKRNMM